LSDDTSAEYPIGKYEDDTHAEVLDDLLEGEHGYKYRLLDDVVMPPYITPDRYRMSRGLEMRPGDICFTGFPKSGSTWLSYILLLLTRDGETPTDSTLRSCLHWVASSFTYPRSEAELAGLPAPRIFKSHMPYHMAVGGVPAGGPCRHIYIARNPKDVVVSYFHFESDKSWAGGYDGPWEHWLEMFVGGQVQRGDWFDHVLSWWAHRDAGNILFLMYEDLRTDFDATVARIAGFLDYSLSDELLAAIREKTAFGNMKQDGFSDMHEIEELGGFFRRGRVGSWREQFTPEQDERFDRMCEERLAGTGLELHYGD